MIKISLIGAGSVVFSKQLMVDILSFPEFTDCTFCLEDIDSERLGMIEKVAKMLVSQRNSRAKIEIVKTIKDAVISADFVINMVQVGGFPSTLIDFEIPAEYGLKQTIADTMSVGGMFRALRTMPVLDEICLAIRQYNPEATLLNYTNPMAMLSLYVQKKYPDIHYVGLCHSVQTTSKQLALYLNIPYEELQYKVAGINHQAWFLELKYKGENLYPQLLELKRKIDENSNFVPEHLYAYKGKDSWFRENFKDSAAETFATDKVRFDMLGRLGYYVTESSEHNAEYCPYYLHDPKLVEEFRIPINEYIRRCQINLKEFENIKATIAAGKELHVDTSQEYAGFIIHSMVTGSKQTINGNVLNHGLITNLPQDCCVEVPCLIDRNGIQPTYIGKLPEQLAAYNRTNINVQMLTVSAVLEKDKSHIYQAVMMDPLACSMVSLANMNKMVDALFEAHGDLIPYFK
ncbi:alpha-glucosidase/alpha-galactosidase [uncultured Sphaerochaeta sp.]|uniref:alpha-glucosidase/alpha-galactosidase n=1 Tax=uncultured Sphaerochaeta sp. TaxID=886478 RepID=UPI002A0A34D9|nr:alpha-glucosidase/alpha-galactosidase [uncultured Sphaerochaeta sp.]